MWYGRHCEHLITNRRCIIHIGAVSDASLARWNMCCSSGESSSNSNLTPSLPEPVKFPGWKMYGRAYKQCIVQSYNTCTYQCYAFRWKSFHMPVQKRRQKGWRVSDLALSLVVFKWHHGSEGVKVMLTSICTAQTPPDWHSSSSSTCPYTNNNGEIKYICTQQKFKWWLAHDMHRGLEY